MEDQSVSKDSSGSWNRIKSKLNSRSNWEWKREERWDETVTPVGSKWSKHTCIVPSQREHWIFDAYHLWRDFLAKSSQLKYRPNWWRVTVGTNQGTTYPEYIIVYCLLSLMSVFRSHFGDSSRSSARSTLLFSIRFGSFSLTPGSCCSATNNTAPVTGSINGRRASAICISSHISLYCLALSVTVWARFTLFSSFQRPSFGVGIFDKVMRGNSKLLRIGSNNHSDAQKRFLKAYI